jgi:hypothetical protein
MVISDIEDDSWAINQILLEHKNMINNEINTLLKEKRKFNRDKIVKA